MAVAAVYVVAVTWGLIGVRLYPRFALFPSMIDLENRQVTRPALAIYGGFLIMALGLIVSFGGTSDPPTRQGLTVGIAIAVGGGFVTPVVEEIWWRGLVYRHLRAWLSPTAHNSTTRTWRLVRVTPALLISSTVFGLSHYLVAPNVGQLVATIPIGIILGLVYEATGRLWAPIASHTLLNAATAANSFGEPLLTRGIVVAVVVATLAIGWVDKN